MSDTTERSADGGPATEAPPGGISCAAAVQHVYEYLDGELDDRLEERIGAHLGACAPCRSLFDFERAFLDVVREKGLTAPESPELRERILALLREEEEGGA
ncbi:MAG TPA: zf-HC2 domain-containing protein [Gemmatimonadota bacterium]|nr:zf-HC2 domain-containing protein [Gemmatimonadota bacterium]